MLDYLALFLVFFVPIVIFYGVIVIHDIPYEIAVHRNHPHQDAIHVAGWISLLFLGIIWPFLWIWATLYKPGVGWGMQSHISKGEVSDTELSNLKIAVADMKSRITQLEKMQANMEE
ncbi:DUF3302 domain-containing protein [Thalassotalea sp. M1531]|uniref:DUF3302 domain-containing protein n=1 Tax=Thalassotalea algicola TaxID=2716224 RepID=A0A7Y0Q653_9GAMM|nr:DUF3302 domain-containing protein [Thalassotalea algicola]NMP31639.1 DUF3302 domain-containing protein [Thalassotalea algicola]